MPAPTILAALARAGAAGVADVAGGGAAAAKTASQALGTANAALAKLGTTAAQATHLLTAGADAVKSLAEPIAALVKLNNPAAVKAFDRAMADAYATIGKQLLPVMQALTRSAKVMGDTYAGLETHLRPAIKGIADALESAFKAVSEAALKNAPAIAALAVTIGEMAKASAGSIAILAKMSGYFLGVPNLLGRALGFGKAKPEDSEGNAVRSVSIGRSGEDVARKAQEAAFAAALNNGKKEDTPEVNLLGKIADALSNDKIKGYISDLAKAIVEALKEKGGKPGEIVGGQVASGAAGVSGLIGLSPWIQAARSAMTR